MVLHFSSKRVLFRCKSIHNKKICQTFRNKTNFVINKMGASGKTKHFSGRLTATVNIVLSLGNLLWSFAAYFGNTLYNAYTFVLPNSTNLPSWNNPLTSAEAWARKSEEEKSLSFPLEIFREKFSRRLQFLDCSFKNACK